MMGVGYKGKKAMANFDPGVSQEPRTGDWGLKRAGDWKLVLCMRPRTCFLTGKQLWGRKCYKGTRIISGPGEDINEYYYIEKYEFIKWNLQGRT